MTQFFLEGDKLSWQLAHASLEQVQEGQQSAWWVQHESLGWMLFVDGELRYTQTDALVHQEMVSLLAVMSHPQPLKVLLVGAEDGLVARQLLDLSIVQSLDWLCPHQALLKLANQHMQRQAVLQEPGLQLVTDEPLDYVRSTDKRYDVMIVDADLRGDQQVMKTHDFLQSLQRIAAPGANVMLYANHALADFQHVQQLQNRLAQHFSHVGTFSLANWVQAGGPHVWVWGGSRPLNKVDDEIIKVRLDLLQVEPRYYTPERHRQALLPVEPMPMAE